MKTLEEVREHFDRQLAQTASPVVQIDCDLCEDGETVSFHAHLADDQVLYAFMDLSKEEARFFDHRSFVAALLALPRSRTLH